MVQLQIKLSVLVILAAAAIAPVIALPTSTNNPTDPKAGPSEPKQLRRVKVQQLRQPTHKPELAPLHKPVSESIEKSKEKPLPPLPPPANDKHTTTKSMRSVARVVLATNKLSSGSGSKLPPQAASGSGSNPLSSGQKQHSTNPLPAGENQHSTKRPSLPPLPQAPPASDRDKHKGDDGKKKTMRGTARAAVAFRKPKGKGPENVQSPQSPATGSGSKKPLQRVLKETRKPEPEPPSVQIKVPITHLSTSKADDSNTLHIYRPKKD